MKYFRMLASDWQRFPKDAYFLSLYLSHLAVVFVAIVFNQRLRLSCCYTFLGSSGSCGERDKYYCAYWSVTSHSNAVTIHGLQDPP
jgi:hypothetical protein